MKSKINYIQVSKKKKIIFNTTIVLTIIYLLVPIKSILFSFTITEKTTLMIVLKCLFLFEFIKIKNYAF